MSAGAADLAVIGLGGVGAFVARAAARAGARVIGFEQRWPAHPGGSSHGESRVWRHAYFEHPDYVPLLRFSSADFGALELESGAALLQRCGVLVAGPPGSEIVAGCLRAAGEHALPVEALDAAGLRARAPALAIGDDWSGVFEADGGFVRPEAAVDAALRVAARGGAVLQTGVAVSGLAEDDTGVTVQTPHGTHRARAVVVCAGAWTAALLPALSGLLRVTRQVQGWFSPDGAAADPDRLPCWLLDRGAGQRLVYGIPCDPLRPGPRRAKIAVHGSDTDLDPAADPRLCTPADHAALAAVRAAHAPGISGPLVDARVCAYTMTPDEHFVLDRPPGARRVVVVAGLSGHGFKLTPALGAAAAGLALTGQSPLPTDFLGLKRFG